MTVQDLRIQLEGMPADAEVLLPIPSPTEAYMINEEPARGVYLEEDSSGEPIVWISTSSPDDEGDCCGSYRDYEV